MQPEHLSTRQLLRNIENFNISAYLTPPSQRQSLGYIQSCLSPVPDPKIYTSISQSVGLDCQMIKTNKGDKLCRIFITNLKEQVLYDKWFDVKSVEDGIEITDMLTHITGINQEIYQEKIKDNPCYGEKDCMEIMDVIKEKIVIGHDLANDLKLLNISHSAFIDTVALIPHPFGLPFKIKLKELAFTYLKKHIQWSNHDPFEDSLSALQVANAHISNGRGTIQIQPFPQKKYTCLKQILFDSQLDINKILYMVLRGSRALGIQMENEIYKSDWDYVVVYDTKSCLDGRLIKLPNIDISFFDIGSFNAHLLNNDISYLQIFLLERKFIYVDKLSFDFENVELSKLRASLGFHLNKSNMKMKRFEKQVGQDPIKYQIKIMKCIHLNIRFIDFFKQMFYFLQNLKSQKENLKAEQFQAFKLQQLSKINIKNQNSLWESFLQQFLSDVSKFDHILDKYKKVEMKNYAEINKLYNKPRGLRYKSQIEKDCDKTKKHNKQPQYQHPIIHSSVTNNFQQQVSSNLETVKFLRQFGIEKIEEFQIMVKRHKVFPNLIQLHYLQSSNFSNPYSRQCRGLILDESRNFQIVALPYYKFFDYSDPKNSQLHLLDWQSTKVYEKKDGSIAIMYFYQNNWHVASATVPDGDSNYCFAKKQTTVQFRKEFWRIFYKLGFQLPNETDENKTFIFEILSENHIIVVKREQSELCLHGVRNIQTLQQQSHQPYELKYKWIVTKPLQISKQELNIEKLITKVQSLDPLKYEGFVLCDKNWTRIKIKNSSYVRINWLGELNLGFNKDTKKYILIQIILSGQAQIFSKYCPEWEPIVSEYLKKIKKLNENVMGIYQNIKHLEKKQYAQSVSKLDRNLQTFLYGLKQNEQKFYGRVENIFNPKKFYEFITKFN